MVRRGQWAAGGTPRPVPTFEGGPEPFLLLLEGRMQLVWQRVEDWGWDDPPPSLSPSCAQGSSLATAPHCGLALTTWTPVEAGSGQTTRLLSTSTGRVVRHQVWGTGRPGDPTGTCSPRGSFPGTLL